MTTAALHQLPLIEQHRAFGARFAPFAGWEMPVQYTGIIEEHMAVRQRAGIFDVSHMGRLFIVGDDAGRLLRRAVTYKVDQLAEGDAHYALMCTDDGGIIDDVFVYRLDDVRYLVVNNASNVGAGRAHIERLIEPGMDAELLDRQSTTVMLALQGPGAPAFLTRVIGGEVPNSLPKRMCIEQEFGGYKLFISRTGYTGEDGFELVTSVEAGAHLLTQLAREGVAPCGLGARDTLRLEAALPLYGNDIDTATNPYEAGVGFAVSLDDDADFSGREALAAAKAAGAERKLACIKALDKGIMRHGYVALHDGKAVATVTSGGHSPVLGTSIGMAYLPLDLAREGTELEIDVRGKALRAVVVKRPFYRPLKDNR
jgi:aminomethyltransferase